MKTFFQATYMTLVVVSGFAIGTGMFAFIGVFIPPLLFLSPIGGIFMAIGAAKKVRKEREDKIIRKAMLHQSQS